MLLESGNVCFLLFYRDVNNLHPLHRNWIKVKEKKGAISILQLFLFYFAKVFQLACSFLAKFTDDLKSMKHCTMHTMRFFALQCAMEENCFYSASTHFKHLRLITVDTKAAFPVFVAKQQISNNSLKRFFLHQS